MGSPTDRRIQSFRARLASFLGQPLMQDLRQILGDRECHLVGGSLRDLALGRTPRDLDLVVSGNGGRLAAELADAWGCRSIRLGGDRFAAFRITRRELPVDLWDRGSATLEADLERRDFSLHALAVDLQGREIYDPFGGLTDLAEGIVRMTTARSFAEDPLRVLRLCRCLAELDGFSVDPVTLDRARESVAALAAVASERIRLEIDRTLEQDRAAIAIDLLIELKAMPDQILGVGLKRDLRQTYRSELARALAGLAIAAADLPTNPDLPMARFALLLIDLQAVSTAHPADLLEPLRRKGLVSKRRSRELSRLLEIGPPPQSEPDRRWWLHRCGTLWPTAVTLSAALQGERPVAGQRFRALVELATHQASEIFDPAPLIDGRDLQAELALPPGAMLGRILAAIRRQQVEGTITTAVEARNLASRMRSKDTQH